TQNIHLRYKMTNADNHNMHNKLRIALLVDSNMDSKYVYDLAEWGQGQNDLEVTHLLIQNLPSNNSKIPKVILLLKKRGFIYTLRAVGLGLIEKAETLGIRRFEAFKNHMKKYDLSDSVKNIVSISPIVSKSGFVYRYEDDEIQKIKGLNLDIIVRCGSGILRGEILHSSRFGIISLHHADNRINRGGPPGFWEVYSKQDNTGFTIQQLTEELDGGNVLFRGNLNTKFFYLLNQAALYEKSNFYLKKMLSDIAATRKLPHKLPTFPYYNRLYKLPTLLVQVKYVTSLTYAISKKIFDRSVFKKSERWGVAFNFGDWKELVMWRGIKIKNPPNHFLADPFVVSTEDENYCFVEDYDYQKSRGCISVYKLTEKDSEKIGEAIIEPFHMSYPCVFQYKSKYYICPETCENKDMRLYECESFPLKWKLKKIIMSNISAVDTTIFEKDGMWWLFTTIDPTNVGDIFSELHIFFSDNPLTDDWIPHKMNPIFVDSVKARMGGILFDEGVVYRVSQQQGFDTYGKSCAINHIRHLTKHHYEENMVFMIEPNFFRRLKGTHHLHSNGKVTVFDFVEKVRTNF
ncbi:MAG TPA: hypothetical protein VFB48_05130, partial [Nitrososphaeraceae archaeon]|nr:hypothetical protein [Nitrososphaeraceae archaeon]